MGQNFVMMPRHAIVTLGLTYMPITVYSDLGKCWRARSAYS